MQTVGFFKTCKSFAPSSSKLVTSSVTDIQLYTGWMWMSLLPLGHQCQGVNSKATIHYDIQYLSTKVSQ